MNFVNLVNFMSQISEIYKNIIPRSVRVEISSYVEINSNKVRTAKVKLFYYQLKNTEVNGFKDEQNKTIFIQFPFVAIEASMIYIEIFYREKGKKNERNVSEIMNTNRTPAEITTQIINLQDFFNLVSKKIKK